MDPKTISTIYHKNPIYRNRLYQLLGKFVTRYRITNIGSIYKAIADGSSDPDIIGLLQTNTPPRLNLAMDSTKRGDKAAEELLHVLKATDESYVPSSYLDIGCNNGSITVPFGERLGLRETHIHGIDVVNFGAQLIKPFDGFDYKQYDGYHIPFESETFDLVTCLMVLHHVERPLELVREMHRILKAGSIVILKEHNAFEPLLEDLIELEHMLYETVERSVSYQDFKSDYYQGLFDKDRLNKLMEEGGFKRLKIESEYLTKKYYGYNPTKGYYVAYKKI